MSPLFKQNKLTKKVFIENINNLPWYSIVLAIITFLIIAFVCLYFNMPERVNWKIGDKAEKTIISNKYISYKDVETEKYLRTQTQENTIGYVLKENTLSEITTNIHLLFNIIREFRNISQPTEQDINKLRLKINPYISDKLSNSSLYGLLTATEKELIIIENLSVETNTYILEKDLKEDTIYIHNAYKNATEYISKNTSDDKIKNICNDILKNTLKPNYLYSEEETKKLIQQKFSEIPDIYRTIEPGDVLISKGENITESKINLLKKAGMYKTNYSFINETTGIILLLLFSFIYVFTFLKRFNIILNNFQSALLLCIILSVCSLGFFATGTMLFNSYDNYKIAYVAIMWIIVSVMLIYNLLSKYLSIFILTFLSVMIGFCLGKDIRIVAISLLVGLCAIWAVSIIKARVELINVFILLAIITVIQIIIIGIISNDPFNKIIYEQVKYAIFTIPMSVLIFFILSGILEKTFHLTTDMRLVELTNADNPLLKNMLLKAPGTYTHSISVSYIAEACAESINANVLLAKAGSYFHDIGKINNPEYFIENQYSENLHNDITPQLSGMVIRAHVKIGVEYAIKFKLPEKVINIIKEHHGTSLVSYFYNKFSENNNSLINVESQFRYEGPRPQTKESAIVMIADSVEAASRSLQSPTPNKIETLVNSIVSGKLNDGQFSECPLTFSDISKIKLTCVKCLLHVLHSRIEYPATTSNKQN